MGVFHCWGGGGGGAVLLSAAADTVDIDRAGFVVGGLCVASVRAGAAIAGFSLGEDLPDRAGMVGRNGAIAGGGAFLLVECALVVAVSGALFFHLCDHDPLRYPRLESGCLHGSQDLAGTPGYSTKQAPGLCLFAPDGGDGGGQSLAGLLYLEGICGLEFVGLDFRRSGGFLRSGGARLLFHRSDGRDDALTGLAGWLDRISVGCIPQPQFFDFN